MPALAPARADPIRVLRRPKPGGGTRRFTLLAASDALAWHELAGRVAVALERRLAGGVLGNRVVFGGQGWTLEPFRDALARARAESRKWAGRVLLTDVQDFYASVTPQVAERAVLETGATGRDARRIRSLLDSWAEQGAHGLPIGPPGSAVVANAVLLPADRALASRPFLRWVDDYRIPVGSDSDVAQVLARMDVALAGAGLRRSEAKTRVAGAGEGWPGPGYER